MPKPQEDLLEALMRLREEKATTFDQRFKGERFSDFRRDPNIEDRRDEGLARGMMGAIMAKVINNNILNNSVVNRVWPSAAAQASQFNPEHVGPIAIQAGAGDLDKAVLRREMGQPMFPKEDPAEKIVYDEINGLPMPTDVNIPPMEEE
jgi:hypothetical protein